MDTIQNAQTRTEAAKLLRELTDRYVGRFGLDYQGDGGYWHVYDYQTHRMAIYRVNGSLVCGQDFLAEVRS